MKTKPRFQYVVHYRYADPGGLQFYDATSWTDAARFIRYTLEQGGWITRVAKIIH